MISMLSPPFMVDINADVDNMVDIQAEVEIHGGYSWWIFKLRWIFIGIGVLGEHLTWIRLLQSIVDINPEMENQGGGGPLPRKG